MDLLDEVSGCGTVVVRVSNDIGGKVSPLNWGIDPSMSVVTIGIGGGSMLDRIAQKSAQGLIWAIVCHELGHVRQWRSKVILTSSGRRIPTLTLAYEIDAWRRAETEILPQLPEHMLSAVLKVWDDIKSVGLRSYARNVRGVDWEMY